MFYVSFIHLRIMLVTQWKELKKTIPRIWNT